MTAEDPILIRLAEIRRAFDASFAAPARGDEDERRAVLAIRAGQGRFVVRIEELAGVEACQRIVPLPGALPGLLGLAGIRGRLLAVYDLGALLDHAAPAGPPRAGPRWLLLCGGDLGLGLLIDEIEALLRVAAPDLMAMSPAPSAEPASEHVRAVLRLGATLRGVIDVGSIVAAVARRADDSLAARRSG